MNFRVSGYATLKTLLNFFLIKVPQFKLQDKGIQYTTVLSVFLNLVPQFNPHKDKPL